jgi:CRISPR-associated protein Cas5t
VVGNGSRLTAVRARLRGFTASFRHPRVAVGRHMTLPVPPPSTVYGLLSAAYGGWVQPDTLRFGMRFVHQGRAVDLEHLHIATVSRRASDPDLGGHARNLIATVSPTEREQWIFPELELYVVARDGEAATAGGVNILRQPAAPLVLGRSQDLVSVVDVNEVELVPVRAAYFDRQLVEPAVAQGEGQVWWLPRYINPADRRRPDWARYRWISHRIVVEAADGLWADPTAPRRQDVMRGVSLLGWVD